MRAQGPEWARFGVPNVAVERRPDGTILMRATDPLGACERRAGDVLQRHSRERPQALHLAARDRTGGWRKITYGDSARLAHAIGQALLDRRLSTDRPVLIVAENGIDHALLALGATLVGIPFVPVSAAYARPGQGFTKLRYIIDLVKPSLIFVDSGARYTGARAPLDEAGVEVVVAEDVPSGVTPFSELTDTVPTAAVDTAAEKIGPDSILKILFTSGSTDMPKGVINTHRMIAANQEMIASVWPFVRDTPPVLLDWLPWSHTFAGNHDFYLALWQGGTYYIDEGKPAPGLIDKTVANLRDVSPTMYLNVPRGYALLLDFLERDAALRERFFAKLDFVFYAGAAMAENLQARIRKLAEQTTGQAVPLICSWGATETAPLATARTFPSDYASNIGLPVAGTEAKLAPVGDKLELRVRGPNITPGYWRRPDATRAAFDNEGFYCSGDAVTLCDPADPSKGLLFDGRITENFKLSTGTWVHVGTLRLAAIAACAPLIEDCVMTGQDRDEVGMIGFPNLAACRKLCPDLPADVTAPAVIAHPAVRAAVAAGLSCLADEGGGSSMRVARVALVADPPTIDANEITDKGYINQRAVLANRAALVERLHAEIAGDEVICLSKEPQ
jgi:feruloyl-CoA synthase